MKPKLIATDREYRAAMRRIEELLARNPAKNSNEGNELDLWVTLVELYENERWPTPHLSPIAAIRVAMDERGLTQADLAPYLGTRGRVSEVLSGKRALSLNMIRKLHQILRIPLDILVQVPNVLSVNRRALRKKPA
ncbi:MAG TPA: helix-turn-helix domain-containing protein [Planctomycetota bacterium]|jgi:HTH-type transcriptional regulator/antitoxin HigA